MYSRFVKNGQLWSPVVTSGHKWSPVVTSGHQWSPVVNHKWSPVVTSGHQWLPVVSHKWSPVVNFLGTVVKVVVRKTVVQKKFTLLIIILTFKSFEQIISINELIAITQGWKYDPSPKGTIDPSKGPLRKGGSYFHPCYNQ